MTIDAKDNLRLKHIIEAVDYIAEFITGVSKTEFDSNYEK